MQICRRLNEHARKPGVLVGLLAIALIVFPVIAQDALAQKQTRAADRLHLGQHLKAVVETRGHIDNGQVAHWQVTLKIGFTMDE